MLFTNEEKLKDILIEVFDIEEVFNIKTLKDLELVEEQLHWDSMAILSLIAACESEYQIIIEMSDYEKINSISTIKEVLSKNDL